MLMKYCNEKSSTVNSGCLRRSWACVYDVDVDRVNNDAIRACVMKSSNAINTRKVNKQLAVNIKSYRVVRATSARGPLLET